MSRRAVGMSWKPFQRNLQLSKPGSYGVLGKIVDIVADEVHL